MENPRRLSKPPSRASTSFSSHLSSAFNSVKARSSGSLQRTPSAPALPGSSHSARSADSHQRFQSFSHPHQPFTSSSSTSLDRSTAKGTSPLLHQQGYYPSSLAESPIEFDAQEQLPQVGHTLDLTPGANPATLALPTVMESSKNSSRNTLRRAPPPPLSYASSEHGPHKTTPSGTPLLRQSMSFSGADKGLPGNMSPSRVPDEHNMLKSSNSVRKKTGFSSFMNSMLGSPKRVEISSPSNPVHVTHVGFNFVTGEFTVRFIQVIWRRYKLMLIQ